MLLIILTFIFGCSHEIRTAKHGSETNGLFPLKTAGDTLIVNATLIDTITPKQLQYLPDHMALSMRFRVENIDKKVFEYDVFIYSPGAFGKDFFLPGNRYNIYGNFKHRMTAFQYAKVYPGEVPFFNCDSIFQIK